MMTPGLLFVELEHDSHGRPASQADHDRDGCAGFEVTSPAPSITAGIIHGTYYSI
jgi:hypothetical protein